MTVIAVNIPSVTKTTAIIRLIRMRSRLSRFVRVVAEMKIFLTIFERI